MIKKTLTMAVLVGLTLTSCADKKEPNADKETKQDQNDNVSNEELEEIEDEFTQDLPFEDKLYYVEDFLQLHKDNKAEDEWNGLKVKIWGVISQDTKGSNAYYNDSTTYGIYLTADPRFYGKDSGYFANWTSTIYFDPSEYLKDSTLVWEKGDTVTLSAIFMNHWTKGPGFDRARLLQN